MYFNAMQRKKEKKENKINVEKRDIFLTVRKYYKK